MYKPPDVIRGEQYLEISGFKLIITKSEKPTGNTHKPGKDNDRKPPKQQSHSMQFGVGAM